MQLGVIGLGRMGGNIVRRLQRGGHTCTVFDVVPESVMALTQGGAVGAYSLDELIETLPQPRVIWLMVPAGEPTEQLVTTLAQRLAAEDIVIDGGNSYFKDDIRRAAFLQERGIYYLDVGTSGGIWGLERGFCLMIGGPRAVVQQLTPLFQTLAPGRGNLARIPRQEERDRTAEEGYLHCGPVGAGHFVKMIHNGIEYGLMQAYAEGFDILRNATTPEVSAAYHYEFNLADIAEVWRRGSVISSWLLDLAAAALAEDPTLARYTGVVADSGEGRWTVMTAVEEAVPAEVLSAALYARFRSRQTHTFAEKMLSALRQQFGGHLERPYEEYAERRSQ